MHCHYCFVLTHINNQRCPSQLPKRLCAIVADEMYATDVILAEIYGYETFGVNLLLKSYRIIYTEGRYIFIENMGYLGCGVKKYNF